MEIIHVQDQNYDTLVSKGKVLVDFYANWCGPCKMLAPVLENFSKQSEDIQVLKVNVDERSDIAETFGIMSIPTLLLYNDGKVVSQKQGFLTLEMLNEWVNSIK